jgi:hypothetical protein
MPPTGKGHQSPMTPARTPSLSRPPQHSDEQIESNHTKDEKMLLSISSKRSFEKEEGMGEFD